jgi:hypothetical protein
MGKTSQIKGEEKKGIELVMVSDIPHPLSARYLGYKEARAPL